MKTTRTTKRGKKVTAPAVQVIGWKPWDLRILCACCGVKADLHRGNDGKCPATHGWGKVEEQRWFSSFETDAELDAYLDAYWAKSATNYREMRAARPF
jgi:hypothetical protein